MGQGWSCLGWILRRIMTNKLPTDLFCSWSTFLGPIILLYSVKPAHYVFFSSLSSVFRAGGRPGVSELQPVSTETVCGRNESTRSAAGHRHRSENHSVQDLCRFIREFNIKLDKRKVSLSLSSVFLRSVCPGDSSDPDSAEVQTQLGAERRERPLL